MDYYISVDVSLGLETKNVFRAGRQDWEKSISKLANFMHCTMCSTLGSFCPENLLFRTIRYDTSISVTINSREVNTFHMTKNHMIHHIFCITITLLIDLHVVGGWVFSDCKMELSILTSAKCHID